MRRFNIAWAIRTTITVNIVVAILAISALATFPETNPANLIRPSITSYLPAACIIINAIISSCQTTARAARAIIINRASHAFIASALANFNAFAICRVSSGTTIFKSIIIIKVIIAIHRNPPHILSPRPTSNLGVNTRSRGCKIRASPF